MGFPAVSSGPLLASCRPLLSLLAENEHKLKQYALEQMDKIVDYNWAEIADHIEQIEELYEDDKFSHRELAALIASKVHYHLEQFSESLSYALGAGTLFTDQIASGKPSQYVFTILSKVIDKYISERIEKSEGGSDAEPIDGRLEAIVESMFDRCFSEGNIKQAVGIALESRRLDKLEACINVSGDRAGTLAYTLEACQTLVQSRTFRNTVLTVLVQIYRTLETPDYQNICLCLMLLEDDKAVAAQLGELIKRDDEESELMAYQIAFDLCGSDMQHFLLAVRSGLPVPASERQSAEPPSTAEGGEEKAEGDTEMKDAEPPRELTEAEKKLETRVKNLRKILSGETTIGIHLEFLFRNNKTDMLILNNIKSALEVRNSITHQATVFANAVMHCGTTVDTFISQPENLEWLKRASNWAKFSATACVGMIHKGCINSSRNVMKAFLPPETGMSSQPYSEGGALYALGLIHAGHGEGILKYLSNELKKIKNNETVQHGACLGLGLAGMASANDELYEDLKDVLFQDNAVAGEAAGLAMGLVMLGTASEKACEEMLAYAQDTQHEKIIRGLAIGMALIMYGREEGADTMIEQLTRDKDPILRYGGMYTIACAYSGTGNNSAIRRLLHVAVSDVSDDVRRAAVTCLGFVLTNTPEQCPRVVSLLAESYNPHVRYGSALACGIACAGTGMQEAIELLEPMTKDSTDFVRQGAMLALAMVLIQETEVRQPKVKDFRNSLEKMIKDKHEDVMAKYGAIIAMSILDAGGRNVTVSLTTRLGNKRMSGIVGMAVFCQYWYWFPLAHFISLTYSPTCLIGLNKDLKMPVFDFISHTKPSTFDYPPMTEVKTSTAPSKVATAILSTTAKTEARKKGKKDEDGKKEEEGADKMDVVKEEPGKDDTENKDANKSMDEDKQGGEKKKEPNTTTLSNPARVLPAQRKYITMPADCRYEPVSKKLWGIVMLRDLKPDEKAEIVEVTIPATALPPKEEEEPPPPEPFEYTD
ncbi:26S proteasome regulatory complex, subunit RPN2 [Guillardia theta CCMP2712]|uniref:26S proteasome regulatory complex, subunit RPN2 n=3 Tax=Guillardia theta TaxID=55529 RepID=L1JT31_GUITC|nr:26S proteasome regulatory complex, subunit RPN2 [Guillardia theta CCMP2712]EKX51464.1 26S proteasome regulatory complex, subunit RPN2 [Guillardia theta CCMP2712]|eukprot:XP_005838444.1 26S proteasome regulatory complex, subunit RPN2 [Guillardia theta CCMP2712]